MKQTHVHKYMLVILGGTRVVRRGGKKYLEKTGGYPVYKCMVTGCAHWLSRDLVIGRETVCWRCGQRMVMTPYAITLKKPHHAECKRVSNEEAV
jgi:hypothetical protein